MKIITKTKKIENKFKKKGTIQSQPKVKISNFAKFLKIRFKKIIQQQNFCLPTRLHAKWFAAGKYPPSPPLSWKESKGKHDVGGRKSFTLDITGQISRFMEYRSDFSSSFVVPPAIRPFLISSSLSSSPLPLPATEEIGITGSKNGLFKGQGREIKYIYLGQCLRANTILYANSRILELFCVT